jgi:stage IV sporulation protein FB
MSDAIFRFRMLGTPVEVGWTAALLMIWIATTMEESWDRVLVSTAVILVSILVHEQGHALAGRAFGLGVQRIVLHGLGGLCQFERAPADREGLVTSLAGPAAGLLLAAACWGALLGLEGGDSPSIAVDFLAQGMWINLIWSLFNLLPMFPLDGGQSLLYGSRLAVGPGSLSLSITRWVSLLTAALVGLWGLAMGMLLVPLIAAYSAWQAWQLGRSRRR